MKTLKILISFVVMCILLAGCIQNTENGATDSMKFGKNITITISEDEVIDSEHLQNVLNGTVKKDIPYFNLLDDDELAKLIEYMTENNLIIKPGKYTFNQSWKFDNGEFMLNSGEKRKIFEFQQQNID